MRYAIQNSDGSFNIDFISNLFPHISFPEGSIDPQWLADNAVYPVIDVLNPTDTQELKSVTPYLLNGSVYTVGLQEISLSQAQSNQQIILYKAYQSATQQNVPYISKAGIFKHYQADSVSQNTLLVATVGYQAQGKVPVGFYWVSADNTQVSFSLEDLQGLYAAMLAQGQEAFTHLQDKKAAVNNAATLVDVQAVGW